MRSGWNIFSVDEAVKEGQKRHSDVYGSQDKLNSGCAGQNPMITKHECNCCLIWPGLGYHVTVRLRSLIRLMSRYMHKK